MFTNVHEYVIQVRGSQDPPVEVVLPSTVTEWGDALFQVLAKGVGLPKVERVWILEEGDDEADAQEYTNPKSGWKAIKKLTSEEIVLVAPPAQAEKWRDANFAKGRWLYASTLAMDEIPVRYSYIILLCG